MLDPTLNQALRTNGEAVWFGWPSDDRLEELRARWLKASDSEARQEIYARRARRPRFCYVAAGQLLTTEKRDGSRNDCRRKIEMSPGAQSRDDTPVGDGHDERNLDCIRAVKLSSAFE